MARRGELKESGGSSLLGGLLLRYRTAAGFTQADLADRAGLSERSIRKLERGELRAPRASTLALLADALGLDAEQTQELRLAAYRAVSSGPMPTPQLLPGLNGATTTVLPFPATPLLGRERELARLSALLTRDGATRLLTLVGPGGVGKTRLALEAARAAADAFADGVRYVPLASLREAELLPATLASALGLRELGAASVENLVLAHLRDREMLLLLDDCEHLAAAASVVADLLAACPHLRVLATSRAALRLRGERQFEVEPLALPEDDVDGTTVSSESSALPGVLVSSEDVSQVPSVALFIERAQASQPDLDLTPAALRAIAAICRRLDGLPLAIELAAARCQILSPQALLARLDLRLPLLVDGARDLPERHRTLRDTLTWSYDLLPPAARTLFRRAGAFADGFALDDIEATYSILAPEADGVEEEDTSVLHCLSILVDQHLLRRAPDGVGAVPRFSMLQTIREYAVMLLDASGEAEVVRQAHADHYLELAEAARTYMRGPASEDWLRRLCEQQDNFRLALEWLSAHGAVTAGLRLAGALWRYWYMLGTLSEGRGWLERFLKHGVPGVDEDAGSHEKAGNGASAHALALHGAGVLCALQGDYAQATVVYEEALTLRRASGDRQGIAATLNNLGSLTLQRGEYGRAEALLAEALAIKREMGDQRGIASSLGALASVALYRGEYDCAARRNMEAIEVCRAVGDQHDLASALNDLANVAYCRGECDRARELCEQSLALLRDRPFPVGEAFALATLGSVAWAQGKYDQATTLLERCLAVRVDIGQVWGAAEARMLLGRVECFREAYAEADMHCREAFATCSRLGAPRDMAECLEALAAIAAVQRQAERGARLWGAAEMLRASISAPLPPVERDVYTPVLAGMRSALGEAHFAALSAEGRMLPPERMFSGI